MNNLERRELLSGIRSVVHPTGEVLVRDRGFCGEEENLVSVLVPDGLILWSNRA